MKQYNYYVNKCLPTVAKSKNEKGSFNKQSNTKNRKDSPNNLYQEALTNISGMKDRYYTEHSNSKVLKESPVKNIDNSRSFKNYDYYNQEINSPPSEDAMNNSFGQNFGIDNNEELSGFGLGELNRNSINFNKNNENYGNMNNNDRFINDKIEENQEISNRIKLDSRLQFLMKYLDFHEYAHLFIQNKINFNDLLLISKEDFIEMKIPVGPRNRILKFISDYKIYAKNYSLDEIKFFLMKNDNFYVNTIEKNNLLEGLNFNNKDQKSPKKGGNYNFSDEVFVPPEKVNDNNLGSPFFASTHGNYLGNLNTDMLNSLQNENNSKDESLRIIDFTNEADEKKKKKHLNRNLYVNGEVFDNNNSIKFNFLPERDNENENIPTKDFNTFDKENQTRRENEILNNNTRNALKKLTENKSLKKDFEIVNEEVDQFMKNFKSQKEKSKERNTKIKCIVRNRMKDRFNDRTQNLAGNTLSTKKHYNNSESLHEGEIEETRNLNEELNKFLNRFNSGSQIDPSSNRSSDSQTINKIMPKRETHNKYEHNNDENLRKNRNNYQNNESDLNKLYDIWDKKKKMISNLNRCNNSIVDKKKIIRLLDEENKMRDPMISSYSDYSEKLVNIGNSHFSNSHNDDDNRDYN